MKVVAIDGPAGSGKGTVANILAKNCNLTYIDTGAMYRAIAYSSIQNNVDIKEVDKIEGIKRIRLSSVEPILFTDEFVSEVSKMDKLLSPVQLFIISTYYGINECEKMTKAQISRTLQMPMNRINVELNAALDKMRTDSRLCNIYL